MIEYFDIEKVLANQNWLNARYKKESPNKSERIECLVSIKSG